VKSDLHSGKLLKIAGRPSVFNGTIRLPPSKSYLHRALFVSTLATSLSTLTNCGTEMNDDIEATIRSLASLGTKIEASLSRGGSLRIFPRFSSEKKSSVILNAGGSGTTARFLVPFSALAPAGTSVIIVGNSSLSKRPMGAIFKPLSALGVTIRSVGYDGRLPIKIEGGGISGGDCEVDGSTSSQFVSSLLIACLRAREDSTVSIMNPEAQVSTPYIDATVRVIKQFGFRIRAKRSRSRYYTSFSIPGAQRVRGSDFAIPGDMSSAAPLIGAAVAAGGEIRLTNIGEENLPQADRVIISIVRRLGATVKATGNQIFVRFQNHRDTSEELSLDLRDSPDIVPTVAGLAAATGTRVSINNIGHLRFKESDRIKVLSRELAKIGMKTKETRSALRILDFDPSRSRDEVLICPQGDHRMLMALAIAGLSGRFGTISIEDPDCVRKSYPSFVEDLQKLCHEKSTLKIVRSKKIERPSP
jgi:3-phosphoshikimate 1-carboxyvinyltransferase